MNIDKMINMLLIKYSYIDKVFYMERKTYEDGKVYKHITFKVGNKTKEFRNKKDLLLYLLEKEGDIIG